MSEESLHQPHDKLFRATFSNPANAAAFLENHLGSGLSQRIDWSSLRRLPGSFIDDSMEGAEADLLFSARVGGAEALFYILWEHQSSEAPLMGLRLLSYMVRVWKKQVEQQGAGATLAPILPVVLAQDKSRWKTSVDFHDLFFFPAEGMDFFRSYTPDFSFRLLQLVDLPYEGIRGTPEGVLTLRSLKAQPLGELLHSMIWERSLIAGVSREAVERFFRYVLNANVDKEAFQAKVKEQQSGSLTKLAMTLAERFRQEGRQEGAASLLRALLEVLEVRFGSVPEGLADALSDCQDLDRLRALHRTALLCPDLESFSAGL